VIDSLQYAMTSSSPLRLCIDRLGKGASLVGDWVLISTWSTHLEHDKILGAVGEVLPGNPIHLQVHDIEAMRTQRWTFNPWGSISNCEAFSTVFFLNDVNIDSCLDPGPSLWHSNNDRENSSRNTPSHLSLQSYGQAKMTRNGPYATMHYPLVDPMVIYRYHERSREVFPQFCKNVFNYATLLWPGKANFAASTRGQQEFEMNFSKQLTKKRRQLWRTW
jgi:hypothetical protein